MLSVISSTDINCSSTTFAILVAISVFLFGIIPIISILSIGIFIGFIGLNINFIAITFVIYPINPPIIAKINILIMLFMLNSPFFDIYL